MFFVHGRYSRCCPPGSQVCIWAAPHWDCPQDAPTPGSPRTPLPWQAVVPEAEQAGCPWWYTPPLNWSHCRKRNFHFKLSFKTLKKWLPWVSISAEMETWIFFKVKGGEKSAKMKRKRTLTEVHWWLITEVRGVGSEDVIWVPKRMLNREKRSA